MFKFRSGFTILALGSLLTAGSAVPSASAAVVPSAQVNTIAPQTVESCGKHFILTRSGKTVKVVGVNLDYFLGDEYGLVFAATSSKNYGPYNAAPYTGANFSISTSSTKKTDITVDLTDDDNIYTLCSGDYYV